jgi:hypothetical protein
MGELRPPRGQPNPEGGTSPEQGNVLETLNREVQRKRRASDAGYAEGPESLSEGLKALGRRVKPTGEREFKPRS